MADKLYFAYGSNINLEQMDYARAFHTSTRDLGERRLTDFLTEYGEAVEEAKRLQASRPTRAASFKKPHIRRR